jgi:hypothetical protein
MGNYHVLEEEFKLSQGPTQVILKNNLNIFSPGNNHVPKEKELKLPQGAT